MATPPQGALSPGMLFHGRYQIVRCLASGGMGAVYECVHLTTQKHRALKIMLPQMLARPDMRERFELEARVTALIDSEHIVETFDAGVDPTTEAPFLVMEMLRGEDLDSILRARGPFTREDTVLLLAQAALALDKTHAAGIIHRDLKPQNLFLTARDDGSPRIKILDFGIAKIVADGTQTATDTAAIGTPVYMAPEQTAGDGGIGPAADLFALGHIAYALLAGEAYWTEEARTLSVYAFMTATIAGAKEPPTARAARRGVALPPGFDAWFARSTARRPHERFNRASSQVTELAAALGVAAPRLTTGPLAAPLPSSPSVPFSAPMPSHASRDGADGTPRGAPVAEPKPTPVDPARLATTGGTMGAVANEPAPAASRASLAVLVALVAIGSTVATVAVVSGVRGHHGSRDASVTPSAMPVSTETPATQAPTVTPQPMQTVDAVASAAPTPSSSPASVESSAKKPSIATSAKPGATPKPAPNCNPPFTVDASGARHAKIECL